MQPHVSVIIPCYNEEQNIRLGALDKVARYMEKRKYVWEVLIVDDGSSDASVFLVKQFIKENGDKRFHLLSRAHHGKAGTVIAGMSAANGTIVLFSDLDQATPLSEVEKILPWFDQGYDIVIGSRKNRRMGAPLLRQLMGIGFMMVRNLILGLGTLEDTQCGFKAFRREVAQEVFKRLSLYGSERAVSGPRVTAGFDVEVLFVARFLGYKIKEVPVEWHYVDTRRVSPVADSLDALADIIKIRLKSLTHGYKK